MPLISYRARAEHLTTKTVEDAAAEGGAREELTGGSTHHPEMTQFIGLVTRVHNRPRFYGAEDDDQSVNADIVIFAPNRAPEHISNVSEGSGDGEFEFV